MAVKLSPSVPTAATSLNKDPRGRKMEEDGGESRDLDLVRAARRQVKLEESRQRRITLMVGTVVLTFLFCWFPFALMFALSPFSPKVGHFFTDNNLVDSVTWLGRYHHHTYHSYSLLTFFEQVIPTLF